MQITKKKRTEAEPVLEFFEADSHLTKNGQSGDPIHPSRTCIVQRTRKEKPVLLRFVLSPQNEVLPDIKGDLPGRGVWVTARKDCVADAVKRRAFQRAYRAPVAVSTTR